MCGFVAARTDPTMFAALAAILLLAVVVGGQRVLPHNMTLANCNPNTLTISGVGAGASMAVQFQYSWSKLVRGAAIVGAVPYLCAAGTLAGASLCITSPAVEVPSVLYASAEESVQWGLIDPLENLKNQTVYLFSGTLDAAAPQPNMKNVAAMLDMAGGSTGVTTNFNTPAASAWITSKYGNNCSYLGSPWVNNCGIDVAGVFLSSAWRDMGMTWNGTEGVVDAASNLFSFDQRKYGASIAMNSLAESGYLYIPPQCQQSSGPMCNLHIHWHGCGQSALTLGTKYLLETQLNEWADGNSIIIVYPQAAPNDVLSNPLACFDWWGYAGEDYALKTGPQITAVRYMIERFGGF